MIMFYGNNFPPCCIPNRRSLYHRRSVLLSDLRFIPNIFFGFQMGNKFSFEKKKPLVFCEFMYKFEIFLLIWLQIISLWGVALQFVSRHYQLISLSTLNTDPRKFRGSITLIYFNANLYLKKKKNINRYEI